MRCLLFGLQYMMLMENQDGDVKTFDLYSASMNIDVVLIFVRKKYIKNHKHQVYKISQAEDDEFPLDILKTALQITHYEFNRRYLYQLVLLCGKLDISCNKGVSEAMRQFTLFLLNEGFAIGCKPETDQIYINKCLDQISINQLTEQLINTAENEFQKNICDIQDMKFCALLCDEFIYAQ